MKHVGKMVATRCDKGRKPAFIGIVTAYQHGVYLIEWVDVDRLEQGIKEAVIKPADGYIEEHVEDFIKNFAEYRKIAGI